MYKLPNKKLLAYLSDCSADIYYIDDSSSDVFIKKLISKIDSSSVTEFLEKYKIGDIDYTIEQKYDFEASSTWVSKVLPIDI